MRAECFVKFAVFFCVSAMLSGCNPDAAAQERSAPPKPEVRTQPLHLQTVPLTTELAGRAGAQTVSEVRPRVSGIILRQSFAKGGMVKGGDILYELDPTPFEASYRNAEAALGALVAASTFGQANDVYFKVGLLTTIGLAAKNAILIVEFAIAEEAGGKGLAETMVEAARQRFRPVLVTSFAFILGVLPLAIADGAGSGSQISIGIGVMGGTISATVLGIFFTPFLLILMRRLFSRGSHQKAYADAGVTAPAE